MAVSAAMSMSKHQCQQRKLRKRLQRLTVVTQPPASVDNAKFVEHAHPRRKVVFLMRQLADRAELVAQKWRGIAPKCRRDA